MNLQKITLRVFLGAYIGVLLYHLSADVGRSSAASLIAFAFGFLAALIAHTRSGVVLFALLCLHMAIEWIHHGAQHWSFAGTGGVLELVHLVFDVSFLAYLSWIQWDRAWPLAFSATVGALAIASVLSWRVSAPASPADAFTILEGMALGGILGCALFHLVRPFDVRKA